ncbi:MAG: hydrogenase [Planctomycetes bacterium]|nr:hydrogenase [Planctomycetota bacterium]
MSILTDLLMMLLVLTNLRMLASSRVAVCIQNVAIQAVVLGAITFSLSAHAAIAAGVIVVAISTVAVKGLVLPWLLRRAMKGAGIGREIEPFVGYASSVLIGAVLLGLCFVIARPLRDTSHAGASMLIPVAMFTILTGLFIIISRRKALTQVLGYLTMENGVCVFGVSLAVEEPLLVEMGILLDVLVGVFVMGIVIHQINREFDHIDTDRLSVLKD